MRKYFRQPLARSAGVALFALTLGTPLVGAADQYSSGFDFKAPSRDTSLVEKVRRATARYRDINVALNENPEHWVRATPCVSGPDEGAMGVHLVKPSRLGLSDTNPKGDEPQALIYEPQPNGSYRLVGVEFIVFAANWDPKHPDGSTPNVEGNLMNLVGEPNRFGLHAFYEMHVWAWEQNPKGAFADWNTQVSCEKQPVQQ